MKKIPVYKFHKHKYGDELLVDVISYEKMMPDIRRTLVLIEFIYRYFLHFSISARNYDFKLFIKITTQFAYCWGRNARIGAYLCRQKRAPSPFLL